MGLANGGLYNLSLLPPLTVESTAINDTRISLKWLFCLFAAGFAAAGLMSIALFTASEGRVQFTKPPNLSFRLALGTADDLKNGDQGTRIMFSIPRHRFENKKQFEFTMAQRNAGKTTYQKQTFQAIHLGLAELRSGHFKYPIFNALDLFTSSPGAGAAKNLGLINKQSVADEINIENTSFDTARATFDKRELLSDTEAKLNANKLFQHLGTSKTQSSLLFYEYQQKNQKSDVKAIRSNRSNKETKITTENLSVSNKSDVDSSEYSYAEDLIPFSKTQTITEALSASNYKYDRNASVIKALAKYVGAKQLPYNAIIRLGLASDDEGNESIVRATIYKDAVAVLSVAINDNLEYVAAEAPEMTPIFKKALSGKLPVLSMGRDPLMPIYDSIYRAILSYGLPEELGKQLFRILATDIDLQSPTTLTDAVDIFYPYSKDNKNPDLFYINANISGKGYKYYRYQNSQGSVDYYNADGKSARQFLLRKPVPSGHFTSPFGSRRHPILGYVRMHTGVDWGAKQGAVIIAVGDGVITKAGPARGYGNHTEIQHANGYMSSYSHQSGFAAGIRPGAHVKQGQVIGYVGSTGMSTGAHCHFEILVNNTRVDPMRVRIPDSKLLIGKELQRFALTRTSIDTALNDNRF